MLSELLPNFAFRVTEDRPPFITGYRLSPGGAEEVIANLTEGLSSGETEALTVALDLLTAAFMWQLELGLGETRLLLVDEPDPHLHPDLQVRFARFLLRLVDKLACQVIVATHSTTLTGALGSLGGNRAAIAYMTAESEVRGQEFSSAVQRLVNALGGHALVAPLLGARLLLVEGIDDYTVWGHVPRVPKNTDLFAVLPAGGDQIREHQMALESLFASMRDHGLPAAGFALVDGDRNVPTDIPTEHIKFIKLACHEIENLYITDEVLGRLGTTWEELAAKLVEKANAGDFGEKSAKILAATKEDRSTVDLKGIMLEIVTVADPVTVPWQVRVGQVLGRGRPNGQIAAFLGDEVVLALWGDLPTEKGS
jgi:hypothetical protein